MAATALEGKSDTFVYRHTVLVRITHWINVICITFLVMSGLQIFNAHPALYVGELSDFDRPVLKMSARNTPAGPVGETTILGRTFDTTGVLGLSNYDGTPRARGFPAWITVPSYQDLATGRRWHFFFAWLFFINGAVYLAASLANRHIWRDLVPSWRQVGAIGPTLWHHLTLKFPHARDYNVLQKLTYLAMVIGVLPLMVLTGLTMSPAVDALLPWLPEVFGGRQTARTIHFICAMLVILFVLVHVVLVLFSGPWNNIRSMITGRYRVDAAGGSHG